MAYVKIKPIKKTIDRTVDYIMKESKTVVEQEKMQEKDDVVDVILYANQTQKTTKDGKEYTSAINCDATSAGRFFGERKKIYEEKNGVDTKVNRGEAALGYHIVQSFDPKRDATDPDLIHAMGVEFAERMVGKGYAAVVSTHFDREHLHNHIIINAYPNEGTKTKFINRKSLLDELRKTSDEIIAEHGQSIIVPQQDGEKSKSYKEWKEDKDGNAWKTKLKNDIVAVAGAVSSWDDYKAVFERAGYKIVEHNKYVVYYPKDKSRGARDRTLGAQYTKKAIEGSWERARNGVPQAGAEAEQTASSGNVSQSIENEIARLSKEKNSKIMDEINKESNKALQQQKKKSYRNRKTTYILLAGLNTVTAVQDKYNSPELVRKNKYNPIYCRADWKTQRIINALDNTRKYGVETTGDLEGKKRQAAIEKSKAQKICRQTSYFLERTARLSTAAEKYLEKKVIINQLNSLTNFDEKTTFRREHAQDIKEYNEAAKVLYRTKSMVDIDEQGKRTINEEEVRGFIQKVEKAREENQRAELLQKKATTTYRDLNCIDKVSALAQIENFNYGPLYKKGMEPELEAKNEELKQEQDEQSREEIQEEMSKKDQAVLDAVVDKIIKAGGSTGYDR